MKDGRQSKSPLDSPKLEVPASPLGGQGAKDDSATPHREEGAAGNQEALLGDHQFLTSVLESLDHPFYVLNADDYSVEMANSAARRAGIVPGAKCYAATHGLDRPCGGQDHACPLREVKDGAKSIIVEHVHQGPGGELRHFEIHCHPILDAKGTPVRMIEYTLDITERRRAEDALRKSEAKYRRFVDLALGGVWEVDSQAVTTFVNSHMAEMLEYTVDEMMGRSLYDFMDDEGKAKARANMERRRSGIREDHEITLLSKSGQRVEVRIASTPVHGEDGSFLGSFAHIVNITRRKRAVEALARKNAVDEALLGLSRSLLAAMPLDEMCHLVLDCARALTDSPLGLVGHLDTDSGSLVCPTFTRDILSGGKAPEGAVVFARLQGLWGWVLENRSSLLSNDTSSDPRFTGTPEGHKPIRRFLAVPALSGDRPSGIIALANAEREYTSEDQTDIERLATIYSFALTREQDRRAIAQAKEKLEERVEERTAQLKRAKKRLEAELHERLKAEEEVLRLRDRETLAAVGSMAAGIAHEVKNPLFAITSGIQLLKRELNLEGEQRETLEILLQNTMRMDRLIGQLRTLGSRSQPRRLPVYPAELVKESLTLNRGLLQEKYLYVKTDFEEGAPPVLADRDQLRQVLLNLFQNAIAASPAGGSLDVSTGLSAGRDALRICIRDRGPGIPKDLLERVFEPFFTTKKESSGMGLAITRKIILEHGASIWAENAEGGGAAFTVAFPLGGEA